MADIAAEANTILRDHNKDRIPQEYRTVGWLNVADGSIFTDYVHYLISRIPELSSRDLALNLMCKLYRQGDLERLIRLEGGSDAYEDFKPRIAKVALSCMGWLHCLPKGHPARIVHRDRWGARASVSFCY